MRILTLAQIICQHNDDLKIQPDSELTVDEVELILVKWMIKGKPYLVCQLA
jgi:hypothetical protein